MCGYDPFWIYDMRLEELDKMNEEEKEKDEKDED